MTPWTIQLTRRGPLRGFLSVQCDDWHEDPEEAEELMEAGAAKSCLELLEVIAEADPDRNAAYLAAIGPDPGPALFSRCTMDDNGDSITFEFTLRSPAILACLPKEVSMQHWPL